MPSLGTLICGSSGSRADKKQRRPPEAGAAESDDAAVDAVEMDDEQLDECVRAFNTFDCDGDGRISLKELGNIMRCLGYVVTRGELKQMFAAVDKNRNGFIDYQEFLGLVRRRQRKERLETDRQLARAFRVFDADRDGYITAAELRAALRRLLRPGEVTDCLVDDMIRGADADGDGRVSFVEFVGIVTMK